MVAHTGPAGEDHVQLLLPFASRPMCREPSVIALLRLVHHGRQPAEDGIAIAGDEDPRVIQRRIEI